MNAYLKALRGRKPVTAIPEGMKRSSVLAAIEALTLELRGPLSNVERVDAIHARQDMRDILALMDAKDQLDSAATRTPEGNPEAPQSLDAKVTT